jgi:hypothetical protein
MNTDRLWKILFCIAVLVYVLFWGCITFAADPNQMTVKDFVSHWLEVKSAESSVFDPNVPVKHIFTIWPCNNNRDNYLIVRCKDPNDSLQVTSWHKNRFNLSDWNIFAKRWPGDPNYVPQEPNQPADPCEPNTPTEPNLADILAGVDDPNIAALFKGLLNP